MKSGKELDALIAQKVLGWKSLKRRWSNGAHSGVLDYWVDENGTEMGSVLPKFSSDIEAAWEIVEVLECVQFTLNWRQNWEWEAHFAILDPKTQDPDIYEGTGESAPLAICLCALKTTA